MAKTAMSPFPFFFDEGRPLIGDDLLRRASATRTETGWRIVIPGMDDDGFQAIAGCDDDIARVSKDAEGSVVIDVFADVDRACDRIAQALTITLRNQFPPTAISGDDARRKAIDLLHALKRLRADGWFDEMMIETLAVVRGTEEIVFEGAMKTAYMNGLIETAMLILELERDQSRAENVAQIVVEWVTEALESLGADIVKPVIGEQALSWEIDRDELRRALFEQDDDERSDDGPDREEGGSE